MLFAEVTPEQVVTLLTPLAVIIAAVLNWLIARDAAKKAEKVKVALEQNQGMIAEHLAKTKEDLKADQAVINDKLDSVVATGEITHTLVNNRMGAVLKTLAEMARQLATLTGKPSDAAAANAAE